MNKLKQGIIILCVILFSVSAQASLFFKHKAPKVWEHWTQHNNFNLTEIDHRPWDEFLKKYVHRDPNTGINLVDYDAVNKFDRKNLWGYLNYLQSLKISEYNTNEQMSYWINLYNATMVNIILDHLNETKVKDINISDHLLVRGPWGARLLKVEGKQLSLQDIQHRILRPIYHEPRLHYVLSDGCMGCPNLQTEAFTSENLQRLLELSAREYINSSRGVAVKDHEVYASMIYHWYIEDFDGTDVGVLSHIRRYAQPELAGIVADYHGHLRFHYNWLMNRQRLAHLLG